MVEKNKASLAVALEEADDNRSVIERLNKYKWMIKPHVFLDNYSLHI